MTQHVETPISDGREDAIFPLDPEALVLDVAEARELGRKYAEKYQSGRPYDHIGLDNFLPASVVERVREEALKLGEKSPEHMSPQEHLKTSYKPEVMPAYSRLVFSALNSPAFLGFLEEMTGIPNLIPDPYFKGAGIHRTNNGGYLGIHADFNYHEEMDLERRLNVLIYLNPDWTEEYGGSFEVWTDDMSAQIARFTPTMNRMCCFSTSSTSMHGNPEPVNHPNGDPRLSIALYYYTATWSDANVEHSTLFKTRPGSADVDNPYERRRYMVRKYLPKPAASFVEKVMYRLGM